MWGDFCFGRGWRDRWEPDNFKYFISMWVHYYFIRQETFALLVPLKSLTIRETFSKYDCVNTSSCTFCIIFNGIEITINFCRFSFIPLKAQNDQTFYCGEFSISTLGHELCFVSGYYKKYILTRLVWLNTIFFFNRVIIVVFRKNTLYDNVQKTIVVERYFADSQNTIFCT